METLEKRKRTLPPGMTPWKPGQSGNPKGRPRKRPQSEANEEILRGVIPEMMRLQLNTVMKNGVPVRLELLKPGATWADASALGLAKKAAQGDVPAAKELRESVEGKSVQRIEMSGNLDNRAPRFVVAYATPIPGERQAIVIEQVAKEKIIEAVVVSEMDENPDGNGEDTATKERK